MKVGILHQDLEHQEIMLNNAFKKNGICSNLYDVRKTSLEELNQNNLILNRVFASVANRNYLDNLKALDYLQELEKSGIEVINSYFTTRCDYSKYFSSKIMEENGVKNPKTFFVNDLNNIENVKEFYNKIGFSKNKPVVFKRDMGGRGNDIHLVQGFEDLENLLSISLQNESYKGGYILQEFVESIMPYDYRISIIDNQITYAMGRSFIDTHENYNWVSSISLGSKEVSLVKIPEGIEKLALDATNFIGAFFSDVDIILTKEGPYIIENNPTPNFAKRTNPSEKQKIVLDNLVRKLKNNFN